MPSKNTLCTITPSQTAASTFSWISAVVAQAESELLVIAYSWLVPPFLSKSDHTTLGHCLRQQVGAKLVFALWGAACQWAITRIAPTRVCQSSVFQFSAASRRSRLEKY
jgi:hypothetical protein